MTKEEKLRLAPAVRDLQARLKLRQDEFREVLGYGNNATVSGFVNAGPTPEVLPRLARVAQDNGFEDLKQIFTDAFYAEYPDLTVLMGSTSPQNSALFSGNVGDVQHKTDVHSIAGDLYEMLDEIVSLGEPGIGWARDYLTAALAEARIEARRKSRRSHGT